MPTKPIIKQDTRILVPRDWYILREKMSTRYQIICDVLLNTGMRIEEFWELVDHPSWFSPSRRCIDLPKGSIGKVRCKIQERTILLTAEGVRAVETLFNNKGSIKFIDRSNMRKDLLSFAALTDLGLEGIKPKMFRKWAVTYLMAGRPEMEVYILASIGHGAETRDRHYMAMGFEKRDIDDMKKFFGGWGA